MAQMEPVAGEGVQVHPVYMEGGEAEVEFLYWQFRNNSSIFYS